MAYPPGPSSASSATGNLSFLFAATEIRPDFDVRAPRFTSSTAAPLWLPPRRKADYLPRPTDTFNGPIYRWMNGGAVESINRSTYPRARELNTKSSNPWTYSTYTVFVQQNNGNILAVDFDARRKDLRDSEIQEWRDIGFHHMTANNSVFTYLDAPGDHTHLAAGSPTNSATWINQLFPQQYHSNPGPSAPYPSLRHAGLIGRLPLIFTLAALSCAQHQVDFIFTHCIGPRRWTVHNVGHNRERERGVVVTVWRDPANPASTNEAIRSLEEGHFGPIFGF